MINKPVVTKLWMAAPARIETNGQKKRSEPIANAATTTMRKLLKYRPRGFDDRGSVVIDVYDHGGQSCAGTR